MGAMRLLIVEDDPDGRELMAELFRLHDWVVTAVPTTTEGLEQLRSARFDLIISDEDIEGHSGSRMLCEASREGLLGRTGVVMYTAEEETLEVPDGARVLQKPVPTRQLLSEAAEVAADVPPSSALSSGAAR
ncbi:MAG: hypothetical protein JWP97_706 [Labilithrix sp.]|nr:hypothetical protein [Labilithrix sp.]